ncbi:hypothetical protein [Tautonia plasticadhaerens]|uniref:Uncharacterized protein n=1 Tax=Tautonia plasticadhaerens TaxID=2527974 RepID=A0A518GVV4_9BACT|nr:hypothetical protein [Tautonia plasticadhaerens]QDV32730.1 hypothetical protein ElP_05700 [Tautonia plasticadhaerens]
MLGTTLVREAPAPTRPGPSRPVPPPVLIEVPTLPGSRPHRARPSSRRQASAPGPRRRLRREVRVAAVALVVGALAASAAFAIRGGPSGEVDRPVGPPPGVPDPFPIELEQPIPEPAGSIRPGTDPGPMPVAFPGYLLPGDGAFGLDGEEEQSHERP